MLGVEDCTIVRAMVDPDAASDTYRTIRTPARLETKVQGSRFIGISFPVRTREEAVAALKGIKKEFYDATHHCYAYRLGPAGAEFRSGDDGEPGGTGGRPILAAIDRKGMRDVMVVVVRYFGGTKLGIPGLGRAYGHAADAVLEASEPQECHVTVRLEAAFPHEHTHAVMHVISEFGAKVVDTTYDEEVHLAVEIRSSLAEQLRRQLVDRTAGNIRLG
jgi:uncharacterized YigZ family protein